MLILLDLIDTLKDKWYKYYIKYEEISISKKLKQKTMCILFEYICRKYTTDTDYLSF